MDRSTFLLTELLTELQKLNPALTGDTDHPIAGRLNLRAGNGHMVGGDALLSEPALEALVDAMKSLNAYAATQPQAAQDDDTLRIFDATVTEARPETIAEITDLYADLDLPALTTAVLNDVPPGDRLRTTFAIDDMFGHIPTDQDGDL